MLDGAQEAEASRKPWTCWRRGRRGVFWVYISTPGVTSAAQSGLLAGYYRRYLEASGKGELHEVIAGVAAATPGPVVATVRLGEQT